MSIGTKDRCIIQWRYSKFHTENGPEEAAHAKLLEVDNDIETEGLYIPPPSTIAPFADVKPYLSSILPPTNRPDEPEGNDTIADKTSIELEYVYGFRGQDVRNNVYYTKSKRIVSHTGRLGISYDRKWHRQVFYEKHEHPIVSLSISNDGLLVATGETTSVTNPNLRPRIHIWEAASCIQIQILPKFHERSIPYIAFSANRRLLAAVGKDEHHSLCVYTSSSSFWHDARVLAYTKTTHLKVYTYELSIAKYFITQLIFL